MKGRKNLSGLSDSEGFHTFLKEGKNLSLDDRMRQFAGFIQGLRDNQQHSFHRLVSSAAGREVLVRDEYTGETRPMLMFASNNYLGLANHPHVVESVRKAIDQFGVGVGGPPVLNGYTSLMEELEERLAHFKLQESAMVFSSGFSTNLGLISGLANKGDLIVYDSLSHASLHVALRLTKTAAVSFEHNNLEDLEAKLIEYGPQANNIFVAIEGVYSMDGDLAPLDRIIPLCRKYKAYCWLDDAHGVGVMGDRGSGTAEHFGLSEAIDVSMGTFSKVFSVTGGFLAASRDTINYLRFFARPYLFSAALPPMTLAAVLAGLDLIEKSSGLRDMLWDNIRYARTRLKAFDCYASPNAAIIALKIPEWIDIRKANYKIHQKGIFLNAIEFPAVPLHQERFRISFMAEHTKEDINYLATCLEEVWQDEEVRSYQKEAVIQRSGK